MRDRPPLLWDEAVRVEAGWHLARLLLAGDWPGAWTWLNDQTFYPFLLPALHGLLLAAGAGPLAAAWIPGLAAQLLAGLLAARLVHELGGRGWGSVMAAAAILFLPPLVGLAAGAFTEPFGACLYLGLCIFLVRLHAVPTAWRATALAAFLLLGFWVKSDYAVLAALTVAAAAVLLPGPQGRARRGAVLALGAALIAEAVGLRLNPVPKLAGFLATFVQASAAGRQSHGDLLFYFKALLVQPTLGTAFGVGLVLMAATLYSLYRVQSQRSLAVPLTLVAVTWAAYSFSGIQHERYLVPTLGVQCALLGWGASDLVARRPIDERVTALAALIVVVLFGAPNLWRHEPGMQPNPVTPQLLDAVVQASAENPGPVLYLRPLNEVSPPLVALELERTAGGRPVSVYAPEGYRPASGPDLQTLVGRTCAGLVVAVEIEPGSVYDTADYRQVWAPLGSVDGQTESAVAAGDLAPVVSSNFDRGAARLVAWAPAHPPCAGR